MGTTAHYGIMVTGWNKLEVEEAREKAVECFKGAHTLSDMTRMVGAPVPSPVNGYKTFVIYPDCGKRGWPDADAAAACRASFLNWLKADQRDAGCSLTWCHVVFGNDGGVSPTMLEHG